MAIFDPKIRIKTPSRNLFSLSYYTRVTSRMGDLTPVLCKKVVPSDRWKVRMSAITRMAPLANPVYDRLRIDYDAFFVQNRIIDPDWKSFITGGEGLYGETSTEGMVDIRINLQMPTFAVNDARGYFGAGSLADNLGLQFAVYDSGNAPTGQYYGVCSALPFLGYVKIFDDWYRNERLQASDYTKIMESQYYDSDTRTFSVSTMLQADFDRLFKMRKRNYGKDPFTTALSTPLIGGPVRIPLYDATQGVENNFLKLETDAAGTSVKGNVSASNSQGALSAFTTSDKTSELVTFGIDLSSAIAGTIQQLNLAYRTFKFFMKDTYNGNRYVEFYESHYNVRVPDATLERPIFLGRHTQWINFSEIFQSSGSTSTDNSLGDYAGIGIANGTGFLFDETFNEHGLVYVIMSIRPNSTYFQGANQEFFWGDRFSYFMPEFQNIGDDYVHTALLYNEQSSLTKTWSGKGAPTPQFLYGYNRRWFEYLWFKDEMHGLFLLDNNMKPWTFARNFDTLPVLSEEFIKVPYINNPFVYNAESEDNSPFYTDIYFDIRSLRPFEKYENF